MSEFKDICSAKKSTPLEKDLKFLDWAIRIVRRRITFRERKVLRMARWRKTALVRYHSGENVARQMRERKRTLERAFRRVLRRESRQKIKNQIGIEKAYRRVLLRQNNQIEIKLANRLRRRFEKAFRHRKSSRICMELTGTSVAGLRAHLESLFKSGMTWENYGFWGWHIDHIKPVCSFDLKLPEHQRACFHYSNLQPLWKSENLEKGRKH